jgi:hypothetical protein
MKTLNKSQREVLTEKLIELTEAKAICWKLIQETNNDESLSDEHKQSMITLWDLDIHLNEVQIDEIKSLLTNNEF